MKAAVSTACFYPKLTEDALYDLCLSGISTVEIFLNTPSEAGSVYANDMAAMLRRFDTKCVSVHPWTAPNEGFMLFSNYMRRVRDFLEETRKVFQFMQTVGAKIYVLHGCPIGWVKPDFYCERFKMLSNLGKEYGISVTQENVNKYESQSLKFLKEFCRLLGDDAKITLDTKQAVRAGMSLDETVRSVGDHIVHVHLSDHGEKGDCLRIGEGRFQIVPFLTALRAKGFDGAVMLELYRDAFGGVQDLHEDWQRIGRLIARAEKSS
ncbi:MAG: sugar phosphate isomerase/epimerase [Oscillospiraceae bacterium]|nr:sugar phosphate isomerase/epimerase [Oscillospiraceae bacterium]